MRFLGVSFVSISLVMIGACGRSAGVNVDTDLCPDPAPSCVSGTAGGLCSDALEVATCTDTGWTCPDDTILTSDCACLGRPAPGCECTPEGWQCPLEGDGGAGSGDGGSDGGSPSPVDAGGSLTSDGGTVPSGDAGVTEDAGASCTTDPISCVAGVPGGQCGDALLLADCLAGAWQCPAGTIPTDECACLGLPLPGCICTAAGWTCPLPDAGVPDSGLGDAGSADAGDVDAGLGTGPACVGNPQLCISGTPGGACGDAVLVAACETGSWLCPTDTIPVEECACIGYPPPGCTCTSSGWDCAPIDAGVAPIDAGVTLVCDGDPFSCVAGVAGGQCSDVLTVTSCTATGWQCPENTIPTTDCACLGFPQPGCVCTASGWRCEAPVDR